jgi:hypothetical protein
MTTLTPEQVAAYAKQAGFIGQSGVIAIAVAMGESGLNPSAMGDTALTNATWGPSIGLWQIRSLKAEKGKGTSRDATRLTDPAFNARAAYEISSGGKNWRPWTVYNTGGYLRHMIAARKAFDSETPPPNPNESTGDLSGFASFGSAITNPQTWLRLGLVIAGGAALLYALVRLTGADETIGKVGKLAVDVVAFKGKGTIGKAAKAIT